MNLVEYTLELLEIKGNYSRLKSTINNPVLAASLLIGLVEECLESEEASVSPNDTEYLLEQGDVLCYVVLILIAMEMRNPSHYQGNHKLNIAASIEQTINSFREGVYDIDELASLSFVDLARNLAKLSKRYFRDGQQVQLIDIVRPYIYITSDTDESTLLQLNIDKLSD